MTEKEINKAVAEKVMGRRERGAFEPPPPQPCPEFQVLDGFVYIWGKPGDKQCLWSPSTNISHAWEVVEKMRELDYEFSLMNEEVGYDCWFCSDIKESSALAATAPLAICEAALKAVEDV